MTRNANRRTWSAELTICVTRLFKSFRSLAMFLCGRLAGGCNAEEPRRAQILYAPSDLNWSSAEMNWVELQPGPRQIYSDLCSPAHWERVFVAQPIDFLICKSAWIHISLPYKRDSVGLGLSAQQIIRVILSSSKETSILAWTDENWMRMEITWVLKRLVSIGRRILFKSRSPDIW